MLDNLWEEVWAEITRRKRTRDAYRNLFQTPDGKAILKDLHRFCGYDHAILDAGDMNTTVSRLGARSVFLRIKRKALLTDEHIEAAVKSEIERKAVEPSSF